MLEVEIGEDAIRIGPRFAVVFQRTLRLPDGRVKALLQDERFSRDATVQRIRAGEVVDAVALEALAESVLGTVKLDLFELRRDCCRLTSPLRGLLVWVCLV